MPTLEACLEALKKPISEESPFGDQIGRDNQDYRDVREKIMDVSPGYSRPTGDVENPDKIWDEILDHCINLVGGVSKDIMIIGYMSGTVLYKFGVTGLVQFLEIYNEMLENSYSDLFPHKPKFQANSFGWMGMFYEYYLVMKAEELESSSGDLPEEDVALWEKLPDQLQSLHESVLENIDVNIDLDKKFLELPQVVGDYPALARSKMKKKAPPPPPPEPEKPPASKPEPVKTQEPEPVSQTAPAPVPATTIPKEDLPPPPETQLDLPGSDDATEETRRAIIQQMLEYAKYLREAKASDSLAFQLNRVLIWSEIRGLPPVRQPRSGEKDVKETMLSPPQFMANIKPLLEKKASGEIQSNEAFLLNLESYVVRPKMAFWLDFQRVIHEILGELNWKDAQTVVGVETAGFIERVGSAFMDLTFSDGTPFADDKTKAWVKSLSRKGGGAAAGAGSRVPVMRRPSAPVSMPTAGAMASVPDDAGSPDEILDRLAQAGTLFEKWNCVRIYGQLLASSPEQLPVALAILESCRRVAEGALLKDVLPDRFLDLIYTIRQLNISLTGGFAGGSMELSNSYTDYVHEALWLDPIRFLSLELGGVGE